jgi:alanine racemase
MSLIKLSRANLYHNLDLIANHIGDNTKIAAVLKDNAYGHGLEEMATLVSEYGVSSAIVRTTQEALTIQELFEEIIILSELNEFHDNPKFSYTINSLDKLSEVSDITIELKVDSGMHRNGISKEELERAFKVIRANNLTLKGVMTHFRSADELSSELYWQQKNWEGIKTQVLTLIEKYQLPTPRFHAQNSAATLRQHFHDNLVRVGIAMYGYSENAPTLKAFDLKPVLSLWADRVSSRPLKSSERVGYGGLGVLSEDSVISTYDIGYGDGFYRLKPEHDYTLPNGQKIIGKVSMDSLSIQGDEPSICVVEDASYLGKIFDTFSYDVLVKLSPMIKRVVV